MDSFVTVLYALAEHCNYRVLHDKLIRDRLVVGLLDKGLSECMQLDAELTLEKAVGMVCQSEEVKKQQASLRGDTRAQASDAKSVDRVRVLKNSKPAKNKGRYSNKPHNAQNRKGKPSQSQCHKCAVLHHIQNRIVLQMKENVMHVAEMCAGHQNLCMKLKKRRRILFSLVASRQVAILGWLTSTSMTVV